MKNPLPSVLNLCRWLREGTLNGASCDTEFLGDLYQHHCEDARKGRALVQTPGFVRELILDRTLGEVLRLHGPVAAKTIDPTCGCGHFLVDAFRMTFSAWMGLPRNDLIEILNRTGGYDRSDPLEAVIAQIALDQVYGVDLDPVCVEMSQTRLLLEAWAVSDMRMPYRVHVAEGDTLLHHRPLSGDEEKYGPFGYDVEEVRRILAPNQYSAVVANPPYITCKDAKLRDACRERYPTCSGKFSLAVPFFEVIVGLAKPGRDQTAREEQGTLFAIGGAA